MYRESYMHFFAKQILEQWLISTWKFNKKNRYLNKFYILEWMIDCKDVNCGIRLEYPILRKTTSNGTSIILGIDNSWINYPDLSNLSNDIKIEAILDLAIIENNSLKYGIEIVHKHVCDKGKRDFLLSCKKIKVYELSAEWVLSQLKTDQPPKKIPLVSI